MAMRLKCWTHGIRLMTVDQQANGNAVGYHDDGDPYIVFGYGSLIFHVRFITTKWATSMARLTNRNETFMKWWGRRIRRRRPASTSRHQTQYAFSYCPSFSLLSLYLLLAHASVCLVVWPTGPLQYLYRIASHRLGYSVFFNFFSFLFLFPFQFSTIVIRDFCLFWYHRQSLMILLSVYRSWVP